MSPFEKKCEILAILEGDFRKEDVSRKSS